MTAHRKPLYGVGVNDWDTSTKVSGVPIWNYRVWQSMLERCYSENFKSKRPTYKNTTCDVSWLSLKAFTEDIMLVENWQMLDQGWALDKDIVGGVDHYGLDTVCIVPLELNNLLLTHESHRGEYPLGVSYDKSRGKYLASMKQFSKSVNLGRFNSVEEAHSAYVVAKNAYVKDVANIYRGVISEVVYDKLMKFSVKSC